MFDFAFSFFLEILEFSILEFYDFDFSIFESLIL
jgi:hypothetical protein